MIPRFNVSLLGSFHSMELISEAGDYVFTLAEAIEAAEHLYPGEWQEVYNGQEGEQNENLVIS